jgi:hypothetical protein
MRSRVIILCSALVAAVIYTAAASATDSGDAGYRLAGVVSAGSDRVGFLQVPAGGQVLVRKGSVINGGTVVEFSERRLRIAFPDHTLELMLDGASGARLGAAAPESPAPQPRPATTAASAKTHATPHPSTQLSPTPVTNNLSRVATVQFEVNGIPAPPPNTDPGRYVADQLGPAFDLPEHSRLLSVNDQPVTSASQAVDTLQQALQRGVAVLNLDTPSGPRRVYIAPQRAPGG